MTNHPRRHANRFTTSDRVAIRDRVTELFVKWGSPKQHRSLDVLALQRAGAHAIGCSFADLRDVELAEIESIVQHVMEG